MDGFQATEIAYKNGYLKGVKEGREEIIAYIDGKDKKIGKYSIFKSLLEELKEKYLKESEQ